MAILDRTRALPRKFRRITGSRLGALLGGSVPPDPGVEAPPAVAPESVPQIDLPTTHSTTTDSTTTDSTTTEE